MREAANIAIPRSHPRKASRNVPWWTPELGKLRFEKMAAWREYQMYLTLDSLIIYKKRNARFNREKRKAKSTSFEEFTKKLNPSSPTRYIWKGIQTLTGTYQPYSINSITIENTVITNPHSISLKFAQKISKSSETSNFPPQFIASSNNIPYMRATDTTDHLALSLENNIGIAEIDSALKSCKGKTPGSDQINYDMLRHIPISVKHRLLQLYNSILNLGTIPQSFKTAVIVPILKPQKDSSLIENYRPISLIPCMSKIMEKIISKRLIWFLTTKKHLTSFQVGFKAGSSTLDALLFLDHQLSSNFSKKNHSSVLAIDFANAFDKIGCHIVLKKLQDWQVGPKIFNYIKSFLSNRKFRCKANNCLSPIFSLYNGIPQGSPLSVTLFLIAFEEVSKIMSLQPNIKHCLYADDLFLICNNKRTADIETSFNTALSALDNWSKHSGALISLEKCKHLHVCRKHNCNQFNIQYNNHAITNVNFLKILGVIFDNKHSFKHHCVKLRSELATRLNIVKYLSSKKSCIHTNTLLTVTKLIIQSKIDYGLQLYGKCSKSIINKIKTPFHAAVRRSLRAFSTTPTINMLMEGGFQTLEDRTKYLRSRIIYKLFCDSTHILHHDIQLLNKRRRPLSHKSALCEVKELADHLNLKISPMRIPHTKLPPWALNSGSFIDNLCFLRKQCTNNTTYQQIFWSIVHPLKRNGWNLLFTDGTKQVNGIAFAVTNEAGQTLSHGLLPQDANIFEAELQGIISALNLVKSKQKTLICTDSQSVFNAARNIRMDVDPIYHMQQLLIKSAPNTKLMWIPGHSGILGNQHADYAANLALTSCLHFYNPLSTTSIKAIYSSALKSHLGTNWYQHEYKEVNPHGSAITLPTSTTTWMNRCFVRLRLGHTLLTHQYHLTKSPQPMCNFCNANRLTTRHILLHCPSLSALRTATFENADPINTLSIPSEANIIKISNFLKAINIFQLI